MATRIPFNTVFRSEPPSRLSNPFATCWTSPGATPFRFAAGETAEKLVERLAGNGWRGEIVGPHGSGKSTLLECLKPHFAAAGRNLLSTMLRDGQRKLPPDFLARALDSPNVLVIVDGYEQLSLFSRLRLKRRCRRAGAGLLVTSHVPTGLPLLARTEPGLPLVQELVAALASRVPSPITAADVAASHACRGGNVRAILFDLYDRHELLARATRTAAAAPA